MRLIEPPFGAAFLLTGSGRTLIFAFVGTLIGIAIRPVRKATLEIVSRAMVSKATGIEGDHAGRRSSRLVTILERESWRAACASLVPPAEPDRELPWTTRRANFLVENARLPHVAGAIIKIGAVVLEISGETNPCSRMEEARAGLLRALHPDWRGGFTCAVIESGEVATGDAVEVLSAPEPRVRRLP